MSDLSFTSNEFGFELFANGSCLSFYLYSRPFFKSPSSTFPVHPLDSRIALLQLFKLGLNI